MGSTLPPEECVSPRSGRASRLLTAVLPKSGLLVTISAALCIWYAFLFLRSLAPFWFNPEWTTDDALQQAFPFYAVTHPNIFSGDLIAEVMRGYLAPLHYCLGAAITWIVRDPVMTCHWLMLVQIVLTLGFLFFAVRFAAGAFPAWLSLTWLLHTRTVMQRMTGGLPRGWAAPVFAAFLYFALKRQHKGVLITILCACLLHPPAALLIAAAYGIFLVLDLLQPETRRQALKPLIIFALLSPGYAVVTAMVVQRPASVGQMVDYETASKMPEFQRPEGRFPFLPLDPVSYDLKMYAFQPFFHRLHRPKLSFNGRVYSLPSWKPVMEAVIPLLLAGLWLIGWLRFKRNIFPLQLLSFLAAIVTVYWASRLFAFKLYVPNRHLQFPMTFFLITAFSILPWLALHRSGGKGGDAGRFRQAWPAVCGFLFLGLLVVIGTGDGLYGTANFNYSLHKKGGVFEWMRRHTPENALFAGHPTHVDGLPLFGIRRVLANTEVAHPFYTGYYREIKRRLIISLRAHYAASLQEVVDLLEPEGVDYFVFSRQRFYPAALQAEDYFSPLSYLVRELTARPADDYAYKRLPRKVDLEKAPYMPFRDEQSAVVDVHLLKKHLQEQSRGETP